MSSLPHPLLTQHFDNKEIAFTKIDEEIAALRESTRALLAFRNTYTVTYRLPPEVLTRILSFVRHVPRREVYYGNLKPLQWITVTHVSQHWRNVAVGSPGLWTCISSSYRKAVVEEWLRRSKDAALLIDWYGTPLLDPQFVSTSLSRIRDLTLDVTVSAWNALVPHLTSPAPLLEFLRIRAGDISPGYSSTSPIPGSIFAGMTPRLQRLELRGGTFDINSSLFTDLTSLELWNPVQKFTATNLLNTLHKLPGLTSLSLLDVLQQGAILATPNPDVVILPFLKSLSTKGGSFNQDLDFLSHLSFPADTTLYFQSHAQTGDAVTALSHFLAVNKAIRQPSSTVVVDCVDLRYVWNMLRLYANVGCTKPGVIVDLLKFELRGPWNDVPEMPDTSEVVTLFSYLPLTTLTSFQTNCHLGIGTWTSTFGVLPELTRITVLGDRAVNILSSIVNDFKTRCPPGYGEERTAPSLGRAVWDPIFPKLAQVDLDGTDFPESTQDLVTALRARKKVERGIKTMEVTQCRNVDDDLLAALEGTVNVEWDSWMGSDEESENEEDEDDDQDDEDDPYDSYEAMEEDIFGELPDGW